MRFGFEKLWLNDPDATAIIKHTWKKSQVGGSIDTFCSNIKNCATSLQRWHHSKFGNMKRKIKAAQKNVADLNNATTRTTASMINLRKMEDTLDELLA